MGTYISHLRIAEKLFYAIKGLDTESFLLGNMAPDSGVPNHDWSRFDPPRTVTHYLESEGSWSADLSFYRQFLVNISDHSDVPLYSFLLGYFIHLVCDNLWLYWIVDAMQRDNDSAIQQHGSRHWQMMKLDWYDVDRKYIRDHNDTFFWQVLLNIKEASRFFPSLPGDAILNQMKHIRNVYILSALDRDFDRFYPYLNTATMDRFVEESCKVVLEILDRKDRLGQLKDIKSALALLPADRLQPYAPPLGDKPG